VNWEEFATCHVENVDGDLFYPDSYTSPAGEKQVEKARTYCDRCPVAEACLQAALDKEGQRDAKERHGIRGGCIPSERVLLSKTRRLAAAA
jgi:hypothetical protein